MLLTIGVLYILGRILKIQMPGVAGSICMKVVSYFVMRKIIHGLLYGGRAMINPDDKKYLHIMTAPHVYHDDVCSWCQEQFGNFGDRWYRLGTDISADHDGQDYYWFANDIDAAWFKLKWS